MLHSASGLVRIQLALSLPLFLCHSFISLIHTHFWLIEPGPLQETNIAQESKTLGHEPGD